MSEYADRKAQISVTYRGVEVPRDKWWNLDTDSGRTLSRWMEGVDSALEADASNPTTKRDAMTRVAAAFERQLKAEKQGRADAWHFVGELRREMAQEVARLKLALDEAQRAPRGCGCRWCLPCATCSAQRGHQRADGHEGA